MKYYIVFIFELMIEISIQTAYASEKKVEADYEEHFSPQSPAGPPPLRAFGFDDETEPLPDPGGADDEGNGGTNDSEVSVRDAFWATAVMAVIYGLIRSRRLRMMNNR